MQKEITIAGKTFNVSQPYVAGYAITEAEAKALNQVRAENVRNNTASKVKAAVEGTAKEGEPTVENIAAFVASYDAGYVFTLASVGGGRKSTDPVEVEALRIARGTFADWAASKKLTVKAIKEKIGDEAYEAKIAEIAEREDVVKEAKRRVKARQAAAETAMGDLDLGGLDTAAVSEEAST
jgi:hypothetical protein